MSIQTTRLLIFPVCLSVIAVGCASVPPVPAGANVRPSSAASNASYGDDADEDSGWLFDRLTGRQRPPSGSNQPTGVVPASATEPVATPVLAVAELEPEEDGGFDLSDLAPENVYANIKNATGYGPDEGLARRLLEEGEALYKQKQYGKAAGKFKAAAKRWPDSTLEEDALLGLGRCQFDSDQYPKAQDTYDNLLKKYDNSRHLDTVTKHLFLIGQYWEGLHEKSPHWPVTPNVTDRTRPTFDTLGNALKAYETIRMKDPTGHLADDSVMASANAYFRRGRFEDAAYYYDMLRKEYPKSEHQIRARSLGVQSMMRVYQGPRYDSTPLEEADDIADQSLTQFGGQLGAEQARMAQARDYIAEQKAQRYLVMGRFYDGKKSFRSARIYYQLILKEHPRSQAAQQARTRLEAIRHEPDVRPNRFAWLTDWFPSDE